MADLVGKTLGKYRIIERLGRGGMSEVYRGQHPRLDREVAIKVLHPQLAEGSDFLARFEREAKAAAALHHPHIVQIYDFDVEDGAFYMIMEYLGGGTLKDRLGQLAARRAHLPLPEVGRVIGQVAGALDYAHAHGVLHRDVKPSNVLLDPSGRAVLADFGIARIVGGARYTTTGTLMGTPAYMSPEQCRGEELTPRSDLYALGVILYELLTGRVPFEADTPLGIAHKQIYEPLPSPRSFRPDLPPALEPVILKALAKDPAGRYQTAAEMAAAVEGALAGEPAEREAVVPAEPAAAPAPEPLPEEPAPEVDAQATEVMQEWPQAKMTREPPAVDLAESKTVLVAEEPAEAEALPTVIEAGRRESEPRREGAARPEDAETTREPRLAGLLQGRRPLILSVALAAVALVAIVVASSLGGGEGAGGCATIEECEERARQAEQRRDPEAAAAFVWEAIEMVPASEHPAFAHLWCRKGDLHRAMGRLDEAAADFETCIEWTQGDPDLGDLRRGAEEALGELRRP